jgi:GT2 family glycosyltransferase
LTRVADVTAAVASFERPEGVMRCVNSILAGNVLPSQLVIVDQSRDDRIGRILAATRSGLVSLAYIHQSPRGLSASRNAALRQATSPVVAFTDDDCVPADNWIAVAEGLLTLAEPIAALCGRVLPLGEDLPGTFAVSLRENTDRREFSGRAVPWDVGTGGNFIAKRDWLIRVGGFDERLGAGTPGKAAEDAELIYRLLRAGATLRYEPDAIVHHARQSRAQRISSRANYGFGIGSFCGLRLGRGDLYMVPLFATWAGRQCRSLARAVRQGDWFGVKQRALGLRGGAGGLCHGLALSHRKAAATSELST